MRKLVVALVLLVAVTVAVVAACGGNGVPRGAIAKVGSGIVTKADFDKIMSQAAAQATASGSTFPKAGTPEYNRLRGPRGQLPRRVAARQPEGRRAQAHGHAKEIQDRLNTIYQSYGGQKKVDSPAQEAGHDACRTCRTSSRTTCSCRRSRRPSPERQGHRPADPGLLQGAQAQSFHQPVSRMTRHILVKTKAQAEKVRALLVRNNTDANWAKLAKKYSHRSRHQEQRRRPGSGHQGPDGQPALRQGGLRAQGGRRSRSPSRARTAGTSSRSPRSTRPPPRPSPRPRRRSSSTLLSAGAAGRLAELAQPGHEGRPRQVRGGLRPGPARRPRPAPAPRRRLRLRLRRARARRPAPGRELAMTPAAMGVQARLHRRRRRVGARSFAAGARRRRRRLRPAGSRGAAARAHRRGAPAWSRLRRSSTRPTLAPTTSSPRCRRPSCVAGAGGPALARALLARAGARRRGRWRPCRPSRSSTTAWLGARARLAQAHRRRPARRSARGTASRRARRHHQLHRGRGVRARRRDRRATTWPPSTASSATCCCRSYLLALMLDERAAGDLGSVAAAIEVKLIRRHAAHLRRRGGRHARRGARPVGAHQARAGGPRGHLPRRAGQRCRRCC